jgi:hypothetical protein
MKHVFEEGDIVKIVNHYQYEGCYGIIFGVIFRKHQYHKYKVMIVAKRNKRCYSKARHMEFFYVNLKKEHDKDTIDKISKCIVSSRV